MARRASSTISASITRTLTAEPAGVLQSHLKSTGAPRMSYVNPPTVPRKSATFDDYTLSEIRRAATTGIYDIRGGGAKRRLPHFDDLLFLGASMSRYPLEGYRERCDTDVVLGSRFAKKPLHLKIPITIAGMSFGSLSAQCEGGAGSRRDRGGHLDNDGRWRHVGRGARTVADAGLSIPAVALRHEPGRSAQGRCHRDRDRAGGQARWRRHAAGAEDHRSRRGDADAAEGHRSALRVASPRLDRAGRSRDQDPRVARDHRLAKADLSSRSAARGPITTSRWR